MLTPSPLRKILGTLVAISAIALLGCGKSRSTIDETTVALGRDEGGAATMTLRTLESAQKFPQEIAEETKRTLRTEAPTCAKDKRSYEPVVITTRGALGDPAVWRAYPIAIDGWRCPVCGDHHYPVFLPPEEVAELLRGGEEAARRGDLDEAEYKFRRVVSSWPGHATARFDLGSLYLDRAKAERTRAGSTPADVQHATDEATRQLERALASNPPPPGIARFMLGKTYVRGGKPDKGRPLLLTFLGDPTSDATRRAEAQGLLTE